MNSTIALLEPFQTPFESVPFSKINNSDFLPAFEKAIETAKNEVDLICTSQGEPTFENTIEALEFSGERLAVISNVFFNLNSAETNEELQGLAREISPKLSAFNNDILLNERLFERIQSVWNKRQTLRLPEDAFTLLEKTYLRFLRNGAKLNAKDKIKLREIDEALSKQSLQFGENVLSETNTFLKGIEDESLLAGLPDSAREAARELASEKGKKGWAFSLHFPSYMPFMKYAENRALREEMYRAYGSRAFKNNALNNSETVKNIARLRLERAQLLGYASHADFVLERRMAESKEKVEGFLNKLLEKARPAAESDLRAVAELAHKDGISKLMPWDYVYYAEKLRKQTFDLDDELLKPYFPLNQCLNGVFDTAKKLFGLQFKLRKDIDVYHPDVEAYEVINENNEHVALFYADFHPREGKRAGAWMTSFRSLSVHNGQEKRPHISIVCNFSKPTKESPSLLTFQELTTLFHEFGHALHGMLAKGKYPSITGTSVFWDFVELPSQIFENWCYEKECLHMFAKHHQSGELLPEKYIQKLVESAQFQQGYATLRQLNFGFLDMAWHGLSTWNNADVLEFELEATRQTALFEVVEGTNTSCQFSHIFQGGYAAGYYSYKWAEVLDADAFAYFKEKGIFNAEVAKTFQTHILESGGSVHPMILYKRFRGKEPNPEALLKRAGLV